MGMWGQDVTRAVNNARANAVPMRSTATRAQARQAAHARGRHVDAVHGRNAKGGGRVSAHAPEYQTFWQWFTKR